MAFKIALTPTYTVNVKVSLPNDKGTFDTSEFKAKFKRVSMEELDALREKTHADALREVLAGYSDLIDEKGEQVDFNEANVNALLSIPQALSALSEAFWASIFNAKAKN